MLPFDPSWDSGVAITAESLGAFANSGGLPWATGAARDFAFYTVEARDALALALRWFVDAPVE